MQYLGCTMMWSILLCISSGSWRGDKISRFLSALFWMRLWGKMVAWIMILKQKSHRRKCGRNFYLSMCCYAVDPYLLGWACLPPRLILRRQAERSTGWWCLALSVANMRHRHVRLHHQPGVFQASWQMLWRAQELERWYWWLRNPAPLDFVWLKLHT